MTLRLPTELESELRQAAVEDHRSVHQTVVRAVEFYLAEREADEIKADPDALRALTETRQSVLEDDVVRGTEAVRGLIRTHRAS